MTELFWEPPQIVYNRKQFLWLLPSMPSIREGVWPPDHRYTGYVDAGKTKSHSHRAPFEAAVIVATEVDRRIEACGQDGEMLNAYYCHDLEARRIARLAKMNESKVVRRIKRALRYIASGPVPRWLDLKKKVEGELVVVRPAQTYQEFISHRKQKSSAIRRGCGT